MINDLMSAPSGQDGDLRNIYKVGLNTTRLLMVLGDVVCAWLLLRQAEVALDKLGGDVSAQGQGVLRGQGRRGAVLRAHVLPKITAERAIAEAIDLAASWTSTRPPSEAATLVRQGPFRVTGAAPSSSAHDAEVAASRVMHSDGSTSGSSADTATGAPSSSR
jgi:hypothetical protein